MSATDCIAEFMAQWVRPGDCVLDVGANQGLYTHRLLELTGPSGVVHAFEPNPELASTVGRAAVLQPLVMNQAAVSDRIGTAEFFLDVREGLGAVASSMEILDDLHQSQQIRPMVTPLVTLDAYCTQRQLLPDFVKIDVEGHELSVFRGAAGTVNRCRPIMIFEFWETWWERGVRQIFDYLREQYILVRLQDGAIVNDAYYSQARTASVDIGCLPVHRARRRDLSCERLRDAA